MVGAEEVRFVGDESPQAIVAVHPAHVRAAAPAVGLEDGGEGKAPGVLGDPPGAVEEDRPGGGDPHPLQQKQLGDLARLQGKGGGPVDDTAAVDNDTMSPMCCSSSSIAMAAASLAWTFFILKQDMSKILTLFYPLFYFFPIPEEGRVLGTKLI